MKFFTLALVSSLLATPVVAGDTPKFLETGRYATSQDVCSMPEGMEEDIVLEKSGLWGNEFGCNFLEFFIEKDVDSGEEYAAMAIASCGDDSGITRGDMISMTVQDEGRTITVQSQNEYVVYDMMAMTNPEQADQIPSYVSRDYNLCPAE